MMTEKQKLYAKARLKGLNQTQSAIAAGYSPATARQAASRLEKDPAVLAHMDRLSRSGDIPEPVKPVKQKPIAKAENPKSEQSQIVGKTVDTIIVDEIYQGEKLKAAVVSAAEDRAAKPEQKSEPTDSKNTADLDPLEFMRELVGDLNEDPKLRLEAAKALAPYLHAKKGELGKKEARAEDAGKVAKGKYASAGVPPGLQRVK